MRGFDHTSLQGTVSTGWGTSLRAAAWGCAPRQPQTPPSWCGALTWLLLPLETESMEVQGVKVRLCPPKPSQRAVFLEGSNLYIPVFSIHSNSEVTECF